MKTIANELYQIYNQGNNREQLFYSDADYIHFLFLYRKLVPKDQPTVYGKVQLYFIPHRNDLPYSVDTATERAKGMRLCKLVTFIHSHTPGKNNAVDYTLHNEFAEMPVTNAAELLPYFERQKPGEYSVQVGELPF